MPAKAPVGVGKDPALCIQVLIEDCSPCWLGASHLLTHGACQGLGTQNQEIAAFVCAFEDFEEHLSFPTGCLHTLNNEADVCFPPAVTGHPKLNFLSSSPCSKCRQCAAGTQGQSCHFHVGCPRAAFPGHSLVTPFFPVRLFLAGGTLKFVLPTRAWVLKARCNNPAAKLTRHKLTQTLCPQMLESSWVKGWSPGDPMPNTEGFYRDRACTGKQNSKS